jgi:hypothetical protein
MSCKFAEEKLLSYLYDEFAAEERASFEAHLASCEDCRCLLDESRRLKELLNQRHALEPTPDLVVRCRQALDETLDREQLGWRSLFRSWFPIGGSFPGRVPVPGIATALVLAVFGFGLGWTLRPRTNQLNPSGNAVIPSSISIPDLANMKVKDISQVTPDPRTGDVRITVNAERRVILEGSLDDPRIRELLVNAVKGYENAGIRRDALDALRSKSDHPAVRDALLYAIGNDPNAGDRLDVLKAVQTMDWGNDMHQALLSVAEHDKNPGVRFAAIDTLVDHAVKDKDKTLLPSLQLLARKDPNQYVRVKCAEAIHEVMGQEQ